MVDNVLFLLVSIGLKFREISKNDIDRVIPSLSKDDWLDLRKLADIQGVTAIALDGLNELIGRYGNKCLVPNIEMAWWRQFILEWMGSMIQIEQLNRIQLSVMDAMASRWSKEGCRVMVFKGQASGTMYPIPNHRSPGDIDCYLFGDYAKGNEIALNMGATVDEGWYKHSVINYKGETFENHQFLICTRGGRRKKRLEKELESYLSRTTHFESLTPFVLCPPDQWLAMFLTYHSCAHFLSEGLRLKQLLDWAQFLKKKQEQINWNEFYEFCEKYHFRTFVDAATAICVNKLGLRILEPSITTSSPYEEMILNSMLYDNDYVHSSGESAWKNRWHLVQNLFRYRWKYKYIYHESVWLQFYRYALGFLFHTE